MTFALIARILMSAAVGAQAGGHVAGKLSKLRANLIEPAELEASRLAIRPNPSR